MTGKGELETVGQMHELEERIAGTRVVTPQGMLAKVHIVVTDTAAPATIDDLEQTSKRDWTRTI
jgi:hypothetical protein